MDKAINYGVYIGRFQPLHIGHEAVIREALTKVQTLIVVIGSAGIAPTPVNPFTFEQRAEMLRLVFKHELLTRRLLIVGVGDYDNDQDWAAAVRRRVGLHAHAHANPNPNFAPVGLKDLTFALAGYGKDASSYYLSMFPDWPSIQVETQHGTINASDIRHDYLRRLPRFPRDAVSAPILASLQTFSLTDQFKRLVEDVDAYAAGRRVYGEGPFLTADVFITHGKEILLVKRGKAPGRGLLAMPGGFVERNETFYEAGLREAAEETGVDRDDLEVYYEGHYIGDAPNRSLRGRVVTVVSLFKLPEEALRPKLKAGDDAAEAGWFYFPALKREDFFDDHFDLIDAIYNPE